MRLRWYFLFVPIRVVLGEYLTLDGVMRVEVDGARMAGYGRGALLGERAHLEGGKRTSSLVAVTDRRVVPVPTESRDHESLQELFTGHRREDLNAS
jgi:hypothetical protein